MNMFLKKRMEAKKNKKKGFTLIEVIVVIVIIAILAAIAVPSLTRYIGQAGLRADMAMGHNIQVVLQAELSDQFINGLTITTPAPGGGTSTVTGGDLYTTINGPTIATILQASNVFIPETTPATTLTDIQINVASATLEGFVYDTPNSTVNFGVSNTTGGGLQQIPK